MPQRTGKVVVTGGAGFIGSNLVDRLLAGDCGQVVAFDNLSRGRLTNLSLAGQDRRFSFIQGDVRDQLAVEHVLRGAEVVFHLAAQSTVMGAVNEIDDTFTTNVVGTFNVLRAAAREGVSRLVFASSREVYGEPIMLPVQEDAPLLAVNAYGASKIAGEAYCRAFRRSSGLRTSILRLANVYGPRDFGRVIPSWLAAAQCGQKLTVYGGKQVIDFVWIGQAVDALVQATTIEGFLPPINVGSGTGTKIVDLARRIARLAEANPRLDLQPARSVEVTRFIANVERMREILNVEPPLDPLSELRSMMATPAAIPG